MKRHARRVAACVAVVVIGACAPPREGPVREPAPQAARPDPQPAIPPLASAALCNDVPVGRTYVSVLDEEPRESDRVDTAIGAERDLPVVNTRWYQLEVESAMYGALESYPHTELFNQAGVTGTLNGVRPDHTHARIIQGPLTAMKLFEIAFQVCLLEIESKRPYSLWDDGKYQASPTPENARPFCERIQAGAWHRTPDVEDVDACVAYGTEDVLDDPDPHRQWAYMCGAVAASVELWTK